jgi:hypothetical protein
MHLLDSRYLKKGIPQPVKVCKECVSICKVRTQTDEIFITWANFRTSSNNESIFSAK